MKRTAILILATLLLAASSWAQPKPAPRPEPAPPARPLPRLHWVSAWEEAALAAKSSDAPILAFVYLTNHPASTNIETTVFADRSFRLLSSLFVMARVEATRRKDVVEKFGVQRTPTLVLLDSAGELVLKLDADLTTKRVLNAMGRTFLTSLFRSGKREAEAGRAWTAYRRFRLVLLVGEGTPAAKWAQKEIAALDAAGIKKFSQAQIAYDLGDILKAMTILEEIVYEYRGTPTGAEAKRYFDKLSEDPGGRKALTEVSRRREAARVLALGKKCEEQKDLERALIAYWDVARDFPGTPAADEAAARAGAIAADKDLALTAAGKRAKRDGENWLEMAAACEQNKLPDKARDYYKRVIDNYPDTPWAEKARAAITALGGRPPAK